MPCVASPDAEFAMSIPRLACSACVSPCSDAGAAGNGVARSAAGGCASRTDAPAAPVSAIADGVLAVGGPSAMGGVAIGANASGRRCECLRRRYGWCECAAQLWNTALRLQVSCLLASPLALHLVLLPGRVLPCHFPRGRSSPPSSRRRRKSFSCAMGLPSVRRRSPRCSCRAQPPVHPR